LSVILYALAWFLNKWPAPTRISANIEEGYGRKSRKDYSHFLIISRGSATETRGRYEHRLRHWLPEEVIKARVSLCEEIIAILSASIRTLRNTP
jgi:four helix bundle protein